MRIDNEEKVRLRVIVFLGFKRDIAGFRLSVFYVLGVLRGRLSFILFFL